MLVWLLIWSGTYGAIIPAKADPCHSGEIFATDGSDDRLGLFELQADVTITLNGAATTGSTLLDGVFWSDELQQASYERSREFHLRGIDQPTLHTVAEALRAQFNQKAVLTFDYLPQHAPEANAVIITVPDIDIARFRDAFVADSAAHGSVLGGSVTTVDHTLILVTGNGDLDVARRLVAEAGSSWDAAVIDYGRSEFVRT